MNLASPIPAPSSGQSRAAVLAPYQIDALFDDPRLVALTDFAAALCGAPTSLISLVTDESQLFVARTGTEERRAGLDRGFCVHAIGGDKLLVVNDASRDEYFALNPQVAGPPHLRFYAGAPLRARDGTTLGALCVIDTDPRDGLTDLQRDGLTTLAGAVMTLFEAHRSLLDKDVETGFARNQRDDQEQRFKTLADAMPQMVWSTLPDGFHDYFNARWYAFTGVPYGSTDGESWNGIFHPDDQQRAWDKWRASLASGEDYEIEYRLRDAGGNYRWVLGRALPMRDEQGRITRWFGTCTDMHEQKIASEQRELVTNELSHRIKNIFAVIAGLITVSSRQHPEIRSVADDLRNRVFALGKAHDFVRPHSQASRPQAEKTSLHGMLEELLAPYQSAAGDRIRISGNDPGMDDRSATPMALLFHELGTNAAKYGALSDEHGRVTITTRIKGGCTILEWLETGGPKVSGQSTPGFGSTLIAMSVEQQLGGTIEREWLVGGLKVTVEIPTTAVRRA